MHPSHDYCQISGKTMKKLLTVLLAGLLLITSLAGCSQQTSGAPLSGLIISEVVSSNSSSLVDPVFGNPDWIELYNASDKATDLSGYTLSEANNKFEFPEGAGIEAGAYLLIYCCASIEDQPGQYCTGYKLSKSGAELRLASPYGTIQELSVPELESDISYGSDEKGTYHFYPNPTPGAANAEQGFESIEEISSQINDKLKISEILPQSVTDADPYAWIELYNSGDTAIELSDYYITENLSDPKKAKMPAMSLGAGEYAVLRFTGSEGDAQIPFKISSQESTVAILDVFSNMIDKISWDAATPAGISAGLSGGKTVYYKQPSPGAVNGTDTSDSIVITDGTADVVVNEVLLKNSFSVIDEDGDRSPWVELYNTSGQAVNLADYALSDNKGRLLKYRLPSVEIAPNGYAIVYLSGKEKSDAEIHTNFKIGSDETQLFLTNINACTVQTIDLPAETKDNVSYGLAPDGSWMFYPMPTPLAANNTQGFAEIAAVSGSSSLMINEVSSVSQAKDNQDDWIELYNSTSSDMDISGYFLSDSRKNLQKWQIGSEQIGAGGYKVINSYQDGDVAEPLGISLSGETLYLSNPQGLVLDQLDTGVLRPGVSKGRLPDDMAATAFFSTPTKGAQNGGDTISGYCAAPLFSVGGGYQSAPVTLEITDTTPGAAIYYTLDGSTPTPNSTPYTAPITISSTQTVRAIAVTDGKLQSDQTVATYLFVSEKHSLPVICLSMTKGDLTWVFGSQTRSDQRERAGYVEYYEPDGTLGVKFPAGFRIAGAGTRLYPQRSINLYLRGGYGQSEVTYPFFDDYNITTFKSLSLRNMGQDSSVTRLRDAYFQMAVNGMNIDNMQTKFAVVYINGDYYGLYEFKENQNEDYLAAKHGIDADKVEMSHNQWIFSGSKAGINHVFSVAKGNTSNDDQYAKYTAIADSDYFMDYLIAINYFNSTDYYNQKYVHTSDDTLKWRPVFYDLDMTLGTASGNNFSRLFSSTGIMGPMHEDGTQNTFDTSLYYGFKKNAAWCDAFVERYAEVLNTVLTTDRLLSLYDEMVDSMRDEMPRTIKKWGDPSSMSYWEGKINDLRDNIENRRKYAIQGLQSYFGLSNERIKELFPNG